MGYETIATQSANFWRLPTSLVVPNFRRDVRITLQKSRDQWEPRCLIWGGTYFNKRKCGNCSRYCHHICEFNSFAACTWLTEYAIPAYEHGVFPVTGITSNQIANNYYTKRLSTGALNFNWLLCIFLSVYHFGAHYSKLLSKTADKKFLTRAI